MYGTWCKAQFIPEKLMVKMGNNGHQQYLVRHRSYCGRDSGMNQPDDFRPDALVSDDHAGVSLGLLLDFLGSEQAIARRRWNRVLLFTNLMQSISG